ncbi:MAG: SUMF1/EgtB/PvdO family nonheme iron enzyme [Fibrobacter sp.]|nr:SUMF1/EgtB/PvdO family nonheme iron enzyme [Fibrobacter sp.]
MIYGTTHKLTLAGVFASLLFALAACTVDGDPVTVEPVSHGGKHLSSSAQSSDSKSSGVESSSSESAETESSSSEVVDDVERDSTVYKMFEWLEFDSGRVEINAVKFTFDRYAVASTEVTQEAFVAAMGGMPEQPQKGDDYPVVNVSWFDAVLFCNELSKMMGFDTAYTYSSVGSENFLKDVAIDYGVEAFRLPTEIEWEIAAHGGSSSKYYWDNEVASDYVYYGQTSGPVEVASYPPNPYGLYDMAGNAAEWVNDWYGTFPTKDMDNYTGASKGTARVVRGGGWSDPIKDCAPDVRAKKDPLYTAMTLGFRVVYSKGF